VTWDEHRQRLYFALSSSFSWERPFTIFAYSLLTKRTLRFINTWTGGFGLAGVSRNGQYLAYLKLHHEAPAGPCVSRTDIEIVDLWPQKIANPKLEFPVSDYVYFIDKLRWSSPSTLSYVATRHVSAGCDEVAGEEPMSRVIDVHSLQFR
jgi:hypothetical protein